MSVIDGCRRDCSASWRTFFEIYGPIVYRYARHARLAACDADDVVANVMRNFMQALRRGFTVDHSVGRFRYYLRKMTNHEISALWRRQSRTRSADLDVTPASQDTEPAPDKYWADIERQERLRICLERLRQSPAVRARDMLAFERYALSGEPADLVARDLGLSASRVYAIKHEVTCHLRKVRKHLDTILGEV